MIENILTKIDQEAQAHPDRVAFDYLGETNTYGELAAWSSRVATAISRLNLAASSPIVVYGGQTFDMLVAFLGVTKAGHAYIPVDVNSSDERLRSIIETAQPGCVISVEPLPIESTVPVLALSQLRDSYHELPAYQPTNTPLMADNFYIIFTSGTTGKPKGVQISHSNLLSFVNWMKYSFNFENKRVLLQPSFSFDLSVMAIYPTLVSGGTLVVLPKKATANFMVMFKVLPKMGLNTWISTPSLMDICLMDPQFKPAIYSQLERFLFCGEELTHDTAQRLKQRFPNAQIFNTYGPTEATVAVTSVEITQSVLDHYSRLPIGYVKPGSRIMVKSNHARQGELIISGANVSKGYLNNPDKTAAAFFRQHETQAYRSGDLGYFDHDLLFYSGRTDFQIKLNGYRIELEEINHYLNQLSFVTQGVAVPKYDQQGKVQQLIGAVVLKQPTDDQLADSGKLKQALEKLIMPYMVPQRFKFYQRLPLSANGKVDVKALITEVNQHD
ncbi:D-alanine--poly(phosphoribitol) ligase subunit DltA [Secundilactobacillus similis DSM 23365 = JCM 2765]|uniref:D-alanine--D-alanyl carrier protein ligase n=1 Tax=Secundilactobacillus similis DSM 23365 = JCM 2765 TaxID=1423804 RepID=A0A0R2EHT2_9LACO|nr:D-alanine--poly(phosphoribitol) ligase subunit DltA [Secundilactobacillus similis]KRN15952.1 D-alanine--poly(phosphoribitol) ligase subunit 1 [Secundilactobacillus similis DSM 23365 = JCM 2765]